MQAKLRGWALVAVSNTIHAKCAGLCCRQFHVPSVRGTCFLRIETQRCRPHFNDVIIKRIGRVGTDVNRAVSLQCHMMHRTARVAF